MLIYGSLPLNDVWLKRSSQKSVCWLLMLGSSTCWFSCCSPFSLYCILLSSPKYVFLGNLVLRLLRHHLNEPCVLHIFFCLWDEMPQKSWFGSACRQCSTSTVPVWLHWLHVEIDTHCFAHTFTQKHSDHPAHNPAISHTMGANPYLEFSI